VDLESPRKLRITVLRNLTGRGILKRPKGKETRYLSPMDCWITEDIIANAIAESGIMQ